jgi:thiamine-monophosphate kinase
MAAQNKLCFVIDSLPITKYVQDFAEKNELDLLELVMNGGEEFELVFTIPQSKWNTASHMAANQKIMLTAIGRVKEGSGVVWQSNGEEIQVLPTGYDNFREWE